MDTSFASTVDDALLLSNLQVKALHDELAAKRNEIRTLSTQLASLSHELNRAKSDLSACHQATAIRHTEERALQSWEFERRMGLLGRRGSGVQHPEPRQVQPLPLPPPSRQEGTSERRGKVVAALCRLQAILLRPVPQQAGALWRWCCHARSSNFLEPAGAGCFEQQSDNQSEKNTSRGEVKRAALRQLAAALRRRGQARLRRRVSDWRNHAATEEQPTPTKAQPETLARALKARALALRHALSTSVFETRRASLRRRCFQRLRSGWLLEASVSASDKLTRLQLRHVNPT